MVLYSTVASFGSTISLAMLFLLLGTGGRGNMNTVQIAGVVTMDEASNKVFTSCIC